jgi:guanine deaminase
LLQWLDQLTFPTERQFESLERCSAVYDSVVRRTLACGTTTACYYATIHRRGTQLLAEKTLAYGQRAYVGLVCMDRNAPADYVQTRSQAVADTQSFIEWAQTADRERAGGRRLLTPVVTPRFAPTCTPELLRELGRLSTTYQCPVQSHMSENHGEVAWVEELFPQCKSYADVYDTHGLLSERTVMAHCIHLKPSEVDLLAARKVGVAHCPNSNMFILSGVCRVRPLLERGIKVGLGTDVSGGHAASMQDALRMSIVASKVVMMDYEHAGGVTGRVAGKAVGKCAHLSTAEAFHLATQGGAQVLGLGGEVGTFETGKQFDALVVDTRSPQSVIDGPESEALGARLSRFLYNGDDRNIRRVFVGGELVR